jgi:hypothetical protein
MIAWSSLRPDGTPALDRELLIGMLTPVRDRVVALREFTRRLGEGDALAAKDGDGRRDW